MTTRTELMDTVQCAHKGNSKRLLSCSAEYFDLFHNGKSYVVLQSYQTRVAVYSISNGTLYVFDRYSVTTSQHVWKFAREMDAMRITWLYQRSDNQIETKVSQWSNTFRLTAKQFREIIARDYEGYIESI